MRINWKEREQKLQNQVHTVAVVWIRNPNRMGIAHKPERTREQEMFDLNSVLFFATGNCQDLNEYSKYET